MIFTKEQFNEIGDFDLGELCIDMSGDTGLHIFNALPSHLQGLAVQWGFSDTVFRDDSYLYIVEELFKCSWDEYHERESTKKYFNSEWKGIAGEYITLNGRNMGDFSETDKENGVI